MSLHHAAQHLAAQGRGPDDHLIHMSGREVAGLQALARAHGGSLTRNPSTGLPEAGFLDSLMPMIVGAGLAYATGGASLGAELGMAGVSNAALIGGGVGALQAARTGDLGKGLMAGLGAYGGAGLGGAASQAGMFEPSPQAVTTQVPGAGNLAYNPDFGYGGAGDIATNQTVAAPQEAFQISHDQMAPFQPTTVEGTGNLTTTAAPQKGLADLLLDNKKYAAAAAAPTIMDALQPNRAMPSQQPGMIRPYTFSAGAQHPDNMVGTKYAPGQDTSERMWFQPQFTAQTPYPATQRMAAGGPIDAAGGGPVEQMSNNAAIGANTSYPMANMTTSAFATPYQTPYSSNVVAPSGGASVDQSTGELNPQGTRLAGGGSIELHGTFNAGGDSNQGSGGFGGGGVNGYQAVGSNAQQPPPPMENPQGLQGLRGLQAQQGQFGQALPTYAPPSQQIQQGPQAQQLPPTGLQQGLFSEDFAQKIQKRTQQMYGQPYRPEMMNAAFAEGGVAFAGGGISNLGDYSDGGRMLKGPGDGMSDNIPATIGNKKPARLADGEFVVPADVVSHLGNGSTDAGAKQLYQMMDKIRQARTGRKAQGKQINPNKYMPA